MVSPAPTHRPSPFILPLLPVIDPIILTFRSLSCHCAWCRLVKTVNCYVTEDSANLREGTGGMVIYGVTPPWDWDHSRYTDAKEVGREGRAMPTFIHIAYHTYNNTPLLAITIALILAFPILPLIDVCRWKTYCVP